MDILDRKRPRNSAELFTEVDGELIATPLLEEIVTAYCQGGLGPKVEVRVECLIPNERHLVDMRWDWNITAPYRTIRLLDDRSDLVNETYHKVGIRLKSREAERAECQNS